MRDDELKKVLLEHHRRYPKMEILDAVKLAYQNEFGGGHMIRNEADSLNRLMEETATLPKRSATAMVPDVLFEDIGNGLCRLDLIACGDAGLAYSTVNRMFAGTARVVEGSRERFAQKLAVIRACCQEGSLPYPVAELDEYLYEYREHGYPPVSHSAAYREAYAPAYRVVRAAYRESFSVFNGIDSRLLAGTREAHPSILVAIEGYCGSGKSTLSDLLQDVYGTSANFIHMDHFFLPTRMKTAERMAECGGNIDYVRFHGEVAIGLHSGQSFQYRIFDCTSQRLGRKVTVDPKPLTVVEGVYAMHPLHDIAYDFKIFLSLSESEQNRRILERSGEVLHKRFVKEWIPMENRYFDEMGIREQCDLILGPSYR